MQKDDQNVKIKKIDQSQLPEIIHNQFSELRELKRNVDIATQMAQTAQNSAKEAKMKSLGILQKKEAIASIQSATVDIAEAQISQAQAQKISFEYQQKLGEITRYLFDLGVSNIVNNRTVVEEIKKKMEKASEEEMDEIEKQELGNLLKQLKTQEDFMINQQKISYQVKDHNEKLIEKTKKDEIQDKEIALQEAKDQEHDRLLAERMRKDEIQDKEIARQGEEAKELKTLFNEFQKEIKEKEIYLNDLEKKYEELVDELEAINKQFEEITCNLNCKLDTKTYKKEIYISYILCTLSIILALIQYFI